MKKTIIGLAIAAVTLTACDNSSSTIKETETKKTTMDTIPATPKVAELFSCPMHPEVKGKKGDKCPKCEMVLSVPVKTTSGVNPPKTTTIS